jgi:hypothetical protein
MLLVVQRMSEAAGMSSPLACRAVRKADAAGSKADMIGSVHAGSLACTK